MKKLLVGVASVALALSLSACSGSPTEGTSGSSGSTKIALIAKANASDYWTMVKNGAMAAGTDLGVEVSFNGPDTESEGDKQLNQLQSAVNDKPAGIGFAPQDSAQDGAPAILDQAKADGIPVVAFDTPLNASDVPITTVASDNSGIGAQAAEELAKLIGSTGEVAIVAHGETGTAAARRDGFKTWIQKNAPNITIVDVQNGESDPAKSRDKAQGILQAHPNLVGFFGTDDDSTIAIADEVKSKGMNTKVVGVDASPDVLTLITSGEIDGIVTQNPYNIGYKTVQILVEASKGTQPSSKTIVSESVWVTKDNMNSDEVKKVLGDS
ncbi:ABC transporter substrate-binding protein [Propionicicella superfundia]|uniref:ABC transporter substrate-binding protein n=1 Tax=Propionicicella superfundia TaxID=348582 RepID=UPI000491C63C|nr:ABC transporter substrate-binding protein [Propionicicella superfundia]